MSSIFQDAVDAHESTARWVDRFLWEGKPHKSEPKAHTNEEYREFLLRVSANCWYNYDDTKQGIYGEGD